MRTLSWLGFVFGSCLLVMCAALLLIRQSTPQSPYIAFMSDASGDFEIWRMRPDGSHRKRLTYHPLDDTDPKWSPDGRQIVFSALSTGGLYDLYVMPAQGGIPRQITSTVNYPTDPDWSPDGKWIAFSDSGQATSMIYLIQPDDPASLRVLITGSSIGVPTWSPDGQWLIFQMSKGDPLFTSDLYRMRVDGSELTRLLDVPNPKFSPDWSPTGEWIVFLMVEDETHDLAYTELYRVKPDGTGLQRLTGLSKEREVQAAWSPDGQWLIFIKIFGGITDIFKMHADGTHQTQLTHSPSSEYVPAWSPIIDLPLRMGWLLALSAGLMAAGQGVNAFRKSPLVYGGRFRGGLQTDLERKHD